jgi:hypothetical protein
MHQFTPKDIKSEVKVTVTGLAVGMSIQDLAGTV